MNLIVGRKQPPIAVRMPEELRKIVEAEAARNGRSRSAEIVFRLAESVGFKGKGEVRES